MTISRNAPCICGSGKKYKKCCLHKETQGLQNNTAEINIKDKEIKKNASKLRYPIFESDIDSLSNSVVDLIKSKNYDKAKEVCKKLLEEFPDQVDGYERFAAVYEDEGNRLEAIKYYHKTIDFMRKTPGFDEDGINWYLEKVKKLEKDIV